MYLLGDDGKMVDSEFGFDVEAGLSCIVVESRGGANPSTGVSRRNPEYNKLLNLLLARIRDTGAQNSQILLDSKTVIGLPLKERIAKLERDYPVDFRSLDIDEFRRVVGRSIANMHRRPGAKSGGNAQKRIRICVDQKISPDDLISIQRIPTTGDELADYSPGLDQSERDYL